MASVVPIHKSGLRHVANNFRPISILPVLSKLSEKVVCAQLSAYVVDCDLFSSSQCAYRPCHSTEDAVTDAVEWTGTSCRCWTCCSDHIYRLKQGFRQRRSRRPSDEAAMVRRRPDLVPELPRRAETDGEGWLPLPSSIPWRPTRIPDRPNAV